jgi:quercetin 2,3-dioxygenase
MNHVRTVYKIIRAQKTTEGAGVILYRSVGFDDPAESDPFLLFDDFRSDTRADFIKGFPWHPHRGIETITYVLRGDVEHEDSLGHRGTIGPGDVQWMTAGSGIYHQEMPLGDDDGKMYGFQLWANLPRNKKMTEPRYRGVLSDTIPEVCKDSGVVIRVIAGCCDGVRGPVTDIAIDPEYLDISIPPDTAYVHQTVPGHRVLCYVFEGSGIAEPATEIENRNMIIFGDGDQIQISGAEQGLRFLLISGKPLNEPVAWYGPIVMNTEEELQTAYRELENGTFIRKTGV